MGNIQSNKIQCFNALNQKFDKRKTNYFMPLFECNSNLPATWLCEFPQGCYNFFCEDCYYSHYKNYNPLAENENLYNECGRTPLLRDIISLYQDGVDVTSKMPTPENLRDFNTSASGWNENERMLSPLWTEFDQGVELLEDESRSYQNTTCDATCTNTSCVDTLCVETSCCPII